MTYKPFSFQLPEPHYTTLFDAMPGVSVLLKADAPRHTILAATPQLLAITGSEKEDVVKKGIFEVFPPNPADPSDTGEINLRASFAHVLQYKEPHQLPVQRYDVADADGNFKERYWKAENRPVFAPDGEVAYIILTSEDITEQVRAEKRESQIKGIEKAFGLFMDTPLVIGLVNGDDYVLELANNAALKLWGKGREIIGKPILQGLPELEGQGIIELFDTVRTTGQPYFAKEVPVISYANGQQTLYYFDIIYQPYYDNNSPVATGVFTISYNVTEVVLARKKVEESEQRFSNLIAQATVATGVYTGREMRIAYANEAMIKVMGKGHAVIGKTFPEALPEMEGQPFLQLLDQVYTSGETYWGKEDKAEVIIDGKLQTFFFNHTYNPLFDSEGKVYGVLNMAIDVTEQVKAKEILEQKESALRQSEQNFRAMILQAPVAICIFRGAQYILEIVNPLMETMLGRKATEIQGKPFFDAMPEVRGQGLEQVLDGIMKGGTSFISHEQQFQLPRDSRMETHYVTYIYEPLHEGDGSVSGVMVVATDVTEQVLARKRIEEVNTELQFVTDTMPQLVWATEANGQAYFFNKRWQEYSGLSIEKLKGDGWKQTLHPDDVQRTTQAWTQAVQTGATYEIEYRLKRHDGVYHWFLTRGTPMKNRQGSILKWYGTTTDIHDQKLAGEALEQKVRERTLELEKANQDLKRSNQDLENFAYAASHDLKEPIRKIHFFSDRIKERLGNKLEGEDRHYFERLESSAKRMSTLIDDLLLYAHVNRSKGSFKTADLNQMLTFVLDDLELYIKEKNARIQIDPLPTIQGGPRQLQQLFENLLSNALKYSKAGVTPEIRISSQLINGSAISVQSPSVKTDKKYHLIEVRDNGIGFEQADAERIFNVFTRLHGKSEYRGTGVGLSIVQRIVENHGGYIWAESKPGEGSTFFMLFPAE